MSVFSKLAGGAFSHVLCASVIQISNTSHFVQFEASFWVIFPVILCMFMEKGAQRNTLEKSNEKGSAGNDGKFRKLQVWRGGLLI